MPELLSESLNESVVDAVWYLATYPDVAASGIDPSLHYEQYGRAEGRFPHRLQASNLEAALWGGFAKKALPELLDWWEKTEDKNERAYASWALARWYASVSDWPKALPFVAYLVEKLPAYLGHLGPTLLRTEVLLKNEYHDLAKVCVADAINLHGICPDLCLAASNVCFPHNVADDQSESSLRLMWLNRMWAMADVMPVTLGDATDLLSLDNLKAGSKLPTPRGRQPKISVIMPVFNGETFIETALYSVLRQSWRNLEVVVVDDCSTDATAELTLAMAKNDARIKLLRQPENRGAYAARNAALALATGDFLTNHDSDDWSHPQRLELMVRPLLKDRHLMGTLADWVRADKNLNFQCWRIVDRLIEASVSTIMIRREVMQLLGGWDEVLVAADHELHQRILLSYGADSIRHVKPGVPLVIARQLAGSLTMASATHLRSSFFGLRSLYSELARAWHDTVGGTEGLRLPANSSTRAFPAPARILRDAPTTVTYDWLLMGDLSSDARTFATTRTVLDRLMANGEKIALFHWPDYQRPASIDQRFLHHAIEGRVEIVLAEQELNAIRVLIVGRSTLANPLDYLPRLHGLQHCKVIETIREAKTLLIPLPRIEDTPPSLFRADWYLQRYPDVRAAGIDPWQHYINNGAAEGRDPSPDFNTVHYLEQYPQARDSALPVLLHYVRIGRYLDYDASHPTFGGMLPKRPGRKTVLLCAHSADEALFGAERCLLDVLDACGLLKLNVVVSVPTIINAAYINEIKARALAVVCIPTIPWQAAAKPCAIAVKRFGEIINSHSIDLVHANTIMLREPLIAARQANIPNIVHVHESPAHDADLCKSMNMSSDEILTEVLERVDHVLANSSFTAQHVSKPDATHIVGNIVSLDDFDIINTIDPQCITVALISSNLPKKGLQGFVELARELASHKSNIKLLLVGPENTYIDDLRQAQKRGEIPDNFRLVSYTSTPQAAIAQANIIVNLSLCQETFGRTILEGMAARRPILAYRWGALPELIEDGVNGFTFEHGDIQGVANQLREFCTNPQQIKAMGEAGRKRAENYSLKHLGLQLGQAYTQILTPVQAKVNA